MKSGGRALFGYACWKFYEGGDATLFWDKPDLSCVCVVGSSEEHKSGSAGLLLLRRFVLYRFRRLWVSWKKIVKEAALFQIWLLGTAFVVIKLRTKCMLFVGCVIHLVQYDETRYHGFTADDGVDPAGSAPGGG
ncbi:Cysteinyl-tRNA Synthetase [Dorcoceras hygrometricum]|uniref:Cysteinyl-tRNA Synthetase n=1 Tax=Dorcoceras hygrometricum TaxID=472368 RepID=A0A2Z7BA99_9LAMI|nr:Cysteinyl-tRNA Synthetase [Dorcoceras hygrometricum]